MRTLTITHLCTLPEDQLFQIPDPEPNSSLAFVSVHATMTPDECLEELILFCETLQLPEWITNDAIEISGRYECFAASPSWLGEADELIAVFLLSWT